METVKEVVKTEKIEKQENKVLEKQQEEKKNFNNTKNEKIYRGVFK